MNKLKYRKVLIINLIILFTIMSIISSIIAGNVLHTDKCNLADCALCSLILFSSNFAKNIGLVVVNILELILVKSLIMHILQNEHRNRKLTLIELKVIQLK